MGGACKEFSFDELWDLKMEGKQVAGLRLLEGQDRVHDTAHLCFAGARPHARHKRGSQKGWKREVRMRMAALSAKPI